MSSASIAEITSYFIGNVGSDNTKTAETAGQDTFSQVFDKTSKEKAPVAGEEPKAAKADGESVQNHANIQKKNTAESLQEKQQVAEENLQEEQLKEAAEEAGAQLVQEVAKTFNVTVEQVEEVMKTLGITPLDLFSGDNMTQLVLALNPEADALTIVTNEQLFSDLKGLMNTAQDLMNQLAQEFNLGQEQMADLMSGFQEQAANEQQLQMAMEMEQLPTEVSTEVPVEVQADGVKVQVEVETDAVASRQNPVGENQPVQEQQTTVTAVDDQSEKGKSQSETGNQPNNQQHAGESFTANLANQLSQAVDEAVGTTNGYSTSGQDIINQITEHIKLTVKADTTEMELQLHPASLGSIKVQISSKAGVLTASFTTQNEAVKAAIEAQMIQLKENFEQQGLKVEAVEVNVEAHGFERSLDQQQREQNGFQEQAKKSGRRISLTDLEAVGEEILSEDLSDGDKIIADMMIRNGNTVDYTA